MSETEWNDISVPALKIKKFLRGMSLNPANGSRLRRSINFLTMKNTRSL